jgi:quercetin dioxygenase-like cupin family protein
VIPAACSDRTPAPTGTSAEPAASAAELNSEPPVPIVAEPLTGRHVFTDKISGRIRLKLTDRLPNVVELDDASRMAVLKITIQPGARFPWHTHPGPVLVAVKRGKLVYVYADDCIERSYAAGTALVDPGSNEHFAFNPSDKRETVLIATFLGVPDTGALTIPVGPARAARLDARCGVAPASSHTH